MLEAPAESGNSSRMKSIRKGAGNGCVVALPPPPGWASFKHHDPRPGAGPAYAGSGFGAADGYRRWKRSRRAAPPPRRHPVRPRVCRAGRFRGCHPRRLRGVPGSDPGRHDVRRGSRPRARLAVGNPPAAGPRGASAPHPPLGDRGGSTVDQNEEEGCMRFTTTMLTLFAVPALLAAQTPQIPNANASDTAKHKVALALQHRATHTRGSVVGPDDRPVTPATPASGGGAAAPAVPAKPATPAVPASPAQKPSSPGQSGGHRP